MDEIDPGLFAGWIFKRRETSYMEEEFEATFVRKKFVLTSEFWRTILPEFFEWKLLLLENVMSLHVHMPYAHDLDNTWEIRDVFK
jgi:hypothetical protein